MSTTTADRIAARAFETEAGPDPRLLLGETRTASFAPSQLSLGHRQATLTGALCPGINSRATPNRQEISPGCWVDHRIGWLDGADTLFEEMIRAVPFSAHVRPMYDRMVAVPRLSWFGSTREPALPSAVRTIADALAVDYGGAFTSLGANLYRDGADSVAWHSDRIGRRVRDPLVALVSLGEHRPFLLRPKATENLGVGTRRFMLGGGDLLIMGGAVQHRWEHAVPKVRHAGPRISLGFRDPAGIPQ